MPSSSRNSTAPNGPETTRQIADHLRAKGSFGEAAGLYLHLIARSPRPGDLVAAYADCARWANQNPVEGLTQSLLRNPGQDEVRDYLIRELEKTRDDRRLRDLVAAAPGKPHPDWLARAATAAMRAGDEKEARTLFERAREAEPDNPQAAAGLARLGARSRDFDQVLNHLDGAAPESGAADLSVINMRISAHRRLGDTAAAARAASDGLGALMQAGDPATAARLMDRLGFRRAADELRDQIVAQENRNAHRRAAGQLITEGRISDGIRMFRTLGGRQWRERPNPRQLQRIEQAAAVFGTSWHGGDWTRLEGREIVLPDSAFAELARKALALPARDWDTSRVMLVTGTLGAGGAERQLVLTAAGLKRDGGYDVQVASLQDMTQHGNAHLHEELLAAGVTHHDLAAAPDPWRNELPLHASHARGLVGLLPESVKPQLRALCHLLMREKPGMLHAWQDVTGATAALAGLLTGVPRILIGTRSVAPDRKEGRNRPWLRALMKQLLQSPRVRLANNSRSGIRDYCRWLQLRARDIALIHNGFELPEGVLAEPPAIPVIGGVMRLTEEKRPLLWVEAVATLIANGRQVSGLLVGDGPMMAQTAARVAELRLEDRIELAGRQSDMTRQYARMSLLMLTSRTEGLPNVLVEAQACGLPVVATDAGGAAETFVEAETGFLCKDDSASSLARAATPLLDDSALRDRMGLAARQHAAENFSLEAMIGRTRRVYEWRERSDDEHG